MLIRPLAAIAGAWMLYSSPREVQVALVQRGDAAEVVYATGVVEPVTWAKAAPLV